MSVKYTLVLVDGQRVTPYVFAAGGTDTFTDINTLPLNMIDRIEVVKVGAVSQYGSDAIAGVVNIITKKDYQSTQIDGSLGTSQQGGRDTKNLSILSGFGNMNADRYNVTTGFSYLNQGPISLAQRSITSSQNYHDLNGGFFSQPSSFLSTPNGPQALPVCGPGSQVTSATTNLQTQTLGTVCSQNGASAQSIAAKTERIGLKVHADYRFSDFNEAFVDLWGSHNTTTLDAGLAGFGSGALVPSLVNTSGTGFAPFAPTLGGNSLTYYFPDAQAVTTTSNFYHLATGLKGSFSTAKHGDWDWATSYGHSESNGTNSYCNQINAAVVRKFLNGTTLNTFNPLTFNALSGLFGTSQFSAQSKLDTLDATISTANLMTIPAGDIGIGLGAQYQHQSEYINPGSLDFVNPYTQESAGTRNVAALYYQVDIPLLKTVQLSQSGRYDHYNDFGGVFSPRYALRYQPNHALTIYASYNVGFRAPTMIELNEKGSVTYQAVGTQNVNEYFTGNPNLQPEHTKNYDIGFQMAPTSTTDIGLDFYQIEVSHVISQENILAAVTANPSQPLYTLPYGNFSHLSTSGFEATLTQKIPSSIGDFILSSDLAYVWHYKIPGLNVPDFAGNNGANDTVFGGAIPRWKGNTNLSWRKNNWGSTLTWQYTGSYSQVINPGSIVSSYSQFNLSASYSGIKHWTLYASVDNLLNRAPPFDPVWMYTYRGYYDPSLYEYIGRNTHIGATYKF